MKLILNNLTVKLHIYNNSNCEVTIEKGEPENPLKSRARNPKSE
jgi:hypothetical protein